jgi:hypothetical protein
MLNNPPRFFHIYIFFSFAHFVNIVTYLLNIAGSLSMVGSSRYNGPGAALRGQPRAPRQRSRPRDDSSSVISDYPVDSSPSVSLVTLPGRLKLFSPSPVSF